MNIEFNSLKKYEKPDMYLASPARDLICSIHATGTCILRFNDISEVSLNTPKYISGINTEKIIQPCYDLLESRRLIKIDSLGWFKINKVNEIINNENTYKEVSLQSHQSVFMDIGFISENRIYVFYNSEDKYDENYNANNVESVPSIIGQLHKQLGIDIDLQYYDYIPKEEYKSWTITFIDDDLRYNSPYRTMKDETSNGYDFMNTSVENAFGMVWEFDFKYHTIKAIPVEKATKPTDIYLSFDNLLKEINIEEKSEDIVTILDCNGDNLDIRTVNPMGTNYLVNFDYYKNNNWMSQELIDVLNSWKEIYNENDKSFSNYVLELRALYEKQTNEQIALKEHQLLINDLNNSRDKYIDNYPLLCETLYEGENSQDKKSSFYSTHITINSIIPACYKKQFESVKGKYINTSITRKNVQLKSAYDDGYIYFQDEDTDTYCKIIKVEEIINDTKIIRYGVERYSIFDNIQNWGKNISNTQYITLAETVSVNENSLEPSSVYYSNLFTKKQEKTFTCYKNQPKLDENNMFTFNQETDFITTTLTEAANNEYYYFIDGDNNSYCKIDISAEVDTSGDEPSAIYYASGFTRYILIQEASNWVIKHENYIDSLNNKIEQFNQKINDIKELMSNISAICNVQNYIKNNTNEKVYREFQCYWIERSYENTNLAVSNSTTMEEIIDLAKELKECGEKELESVSQPKYSFAISSLDFTKLYQFEKFAKQLDLGKTITIEKNDDVHFKAAVTEISFDLFNTDNFSLTFSNSYKLNSNDFTFTDLIVENSKVSRTVKSNWTDLTSYKKDEETIKNLIANPLDKTLRAGLQNQKNQEFNIDETGILGRKYDDDSKSSFSKEQMRIMNNSILFTDDNWQTIRTALGKIFYGENNDKTAYGLIAETIIGSLIMGETLKIENSDSSIVLNKNGISIVQKKEDGTIENVFKADINGNLSLTGTINATGGYIGNKTDKKGFEINESSIFNIPNEEGDERVIISTGQNITEYEIGGEKISNAMIVAGKNFAVTNKGEMYASSGVFQGKITSESGKIGNFNIAKAVLYTGEVDRNGLIMGEYTNDEDNKKNYSMIGFGKVVKSNNNQTDDNFSIDATTIIDNEKIQAKKIDIGSIKAESSRIEKMTGYSFFYPDENENKDKKIGIEFKRINSSFCAVLTRNGSTLIVTMYKDDELTSFNEAKEFKVYYRTTGIGNHNGETTITIPAKESTGSYTVTDTWFNTLDKYSFEEDKEIYMKILEGTDLVPCTVIYGDFIPERESDLGTNEKKFKNIFGKNFYNDSGPIISSDKNKKKNIRKLSKKYSKFFDKLIAKSYKFKDGESDRTHIGFVAQDVKEALEECKITTKDFAGYCEWENQDGEIECGLRYSEFISLCVNEIQKLKVHVKELEKKINTAEKEL